MAKTQQKSKPIIKKGGADHPGERFDLPTPDPDAPVPDNALLEQPTKAKFEGGEPQVTPPPQQKATPRFTFKNEYIFRLRQYENTSFSGLWELCRLNPDGSVGEVVSDADALNYCLENLMGHLERDGF